MADQLPGCHALVAGELRRAHVGAVHEVRAAGLRHLVPSERRQPVPSARCRERHVARRVDDLARRRHRPVAYRLLRARRDTASGSLCEPKDACPVTGFYTTGNPAILYDNVEGANGAWSETNRSQECIANDIYAGGEQRPMGFFNDALASGTVPDFNLVLPNGCEDGEANCK